MDLFEALETYLTDTGQIHPLNKRQARLLCRSVNDKSLQNDARIVLLLNLAALNRGAPRAPHDFLLNPLHQDIIRQHIAAYNTEHPDKPPDWESIITDPAALIRIDKILTTIMQSPGRLSPLCGPESDSGALLIVNPSSNSTGFSRYWRAAVSLENAICRRLRQPLNEVPVDRCATVIAEVFASDSILSGNQQFHNRQAAACALSMITPFLIVSGGPGTGKTTMVTQLLRTLLRTYPQIEPDRIVLCAPTGRAKARIGESIDNDIAKLESRPGGMPAARARDSGLKNLPRKTLHSLLGMRPDGTMKYTSVNPLPFQIVVVDEASMVDITIFCALLEAAAPDCRIILVGDMNQLPSVEAGAVLGDLTRRFAGLSGSPTLTPLRAEWLRTVLKNIPLYGGDHASESVLSNPEAIRDAGSLADHTIILTHSYRSTPEILDISRYINHGEIEKTLASISVSSGEAIVTLDQREGTAPIMEWLNRFYTKENLLPVQVLREMNLNALDDPDHAGHGQMRAGLNAAFAILERSRILTLMHSGPRGRIAINALAEKFLRPKLARAAGISNNTGNRFFHGQQVILSENLHSLDLYNGDTGMIVESKLGGTQVVFRRGNRYILHSIDRITGIEPAFAMTVHKSQGSEFDAVLLVLPQSSPLLSRQIIYTGLTRAKSQVRILGSQSVLERAIATRETRPGGIVID